MRERERGKSKRGYYNYYRYHLAIDNPLTRTRCWMTQEPRSGGASLQRSKVKQLSLHPSVHVPVGYTICTHVHAHMHLFELRVIQCAHMHLCGLHHRDVAMVT